MSGPVSEFREVQVTVDCADPRALSLFWAEVLGYALDPPPPGSDSWEAALEAWGVPEEHWNDKSAVSDPDGRGPRLFFQKVPEPKRVKNRLHLDVRAAPGTEGSSRSTSTRWGPPSSSCPTPRATSSASTEQ